jgi:hypothetical protein
MFTKKHFKVVSLLEMPKEIEYLKPSIPNQFYPSDHLPIETELELLWHSINFLD